MVPFVCRLCTLSLQIDAAEANTADIRNLSIFVTNQVYLTTTKVENPNPKDGLDIFDKTIGDYFVYVQVSKKSSKLCNEKLLYLFVCIKLLGVYFAPPPRSVVGLWYNIAPHIMISDRVMLEN